MQQRDFVYNGSEQVLLRRRRRSGERRGAVTLRPGPCCFLLWSLPSAAANPCARRRLTLNAGSPSAGQVATSWKSSKARLPNMAAPAPLLLLLLRGC